MTMLEAGVLTGIPLGAITGGVVGKSYGLVATIGGVVGGGIAGGFAGYLYAFFVIFLISFFAVLWSAARGQPEPPEPTLPEMRALNRIARGGIALVLMASVFIGFQTGWHKGLLCGLLGAIVAAFCAVAGMRWASHAARKDQSG